MTGSVIASSAFPGGQTRRARTRRAAPGFSLLEILIALPILAILSLAVASSVLFASRLSRVVSNQIAAKNVAQGFLERMAIDDFENVTPDNYPSITTATSPPLFLDSVRKSRCEVDIRITGYGTAEGGAANTLVDNDASWASDEWKDDWLLLVGGAGRGQRAKINSNTGNTLTIDGTLSTAPSSGTEYLINGGKTVQISTIWTYRGKEYGTRVESLVIDWQPRR
jgi:prepilin-type N-terminal cleavage/methylation domain-containing protein